MGLLKKKTTSRDQQSLSYKPFGHSWLAYSIFIFLGYTIADLSILAYRDLMLPNQTPPTKPPPAVAHNEYGMGALQSILSRNIFSSDGLIPDPVQLKNDPNKKKKIEEPIPTNLPLNLIGTLVHSNPEKSIAAIEIKSKNQILSYGLKRDIENLAIVEKIERGKVFIRNNNNGQLEYLELKTNNKITFGSAPKTILDTAKGEVKQKGENQFEISRASLLKYTSDLSSILMQAQCVPARRPGTGEIYGFRCLQFQPDSIYTQLGLKPMDVICGVNGSPVTSPQQAMELYSALKSSNQIEICIERDGKQNSFKYSISQ